MDDVELKEALGQRAKWLKSMKRTQREVRKDDLGSEYVISTGDENIKVYLPVTLQGIYYASE